MIQKIFINLPSEDGYWVYRVGEIFWGYEITDITHRDETGDWHDDHVFLFGYKSSDEPKRVLRVFNYAHVICEDYV